MRRVSKLAAVTLAGALALTGCATSSSDGSSSNASSGSSDCGGGEFGKQVGLAYDVGGRGDQSFNDAAARGMDQAVAEFDLVPKEQEPRDGESDEDKVERMRQLAEDGFNPIFGVGYAYAAPIKTIAAQCADVNFAIIDEVVEDVPNVTSLVFAEEQGSYLAGVAAALKTETDRVAFIGGVNTPLIQKFEAGFVQGVTDTNPDVQVDVQYISQPPEMSGFNDPAAGKSVANGLMDAGADVIFTAAGGSGAGAIEAIAAKNTEDSPRWAIGVDSDQYNQETLAQYKDVILTSMVKNVDGAVYEYIKSTVEGEPQTGVQRHDLSTDGVYLATSGGYIDDIAEQLEEAKQKIISGEIEVATTP
ncbi:BMP family lipoprotein [Allostreptomyces psammosilenae]|uniref:Basic membrane protein A n=1 Tax=Allostreptomyces psammosilenae TaxID=1892865 RepID=A0A853A1I0_9ACTN|nr:BMP family ABC transporter substrate-binding protein [Allostreptomyces psammosilenae]NYI07997.1 basic membrane protein A [Allostreptomyces psammosilenae]